MSKFNNVAELMQALIDGKKIVSRQHNSKYIHIVDSVLMDNERQMIHADFFYVEDFSIYEEPVKPVIIDIADVDCVFIAKEIVRGMTNHSLSKLQQDHLENVARRVTMNQLTKVKRQ